MVVICCLLTLSRELLLIGVYQAGGFLGVEVYFRDKLTLDTGSRGVGQDSFPCYSSAGFSFVEVVAQLLSPSVHNCMGSLREKRKLFLQLSATYSEPTQP